MLKTVADSYQKSRLKRFEPRAKKHLPKADPLMQETRQILRDKMKALENSDRALSYKNIITESVEDI